VTPFSYVNTARIVFGDGAAADVGLEVKALGARRALLVTDRTLHETEAPGRVKRALGTRLAGEYCNVAPDAEAQGVDFAAKLAGELGYDCLVSLGGGSVIDTAKGIAICLTLGGSIRDHQGTQVLPRRPLPHVAIPTTAGTGSEVSVYAVIRDEQAQEKIHFMDERLIPDTAVLDPQMTVTMPRGLTAATGFDALTHAIEAYTSRNAGPLSDAQALHAARLIAGALLRAVDHGEDLDARADMLVAANLAGSAMSNAGVGLAHAISHVLGARHGVHHGTANAIVLPHVIRFNADELGGRYRDLGRAMGGDDVAGACASLLTSCVDLPTRLRDVGVAADDLPAIADAAIADGAVSYNGKLVPDPAPILGVLEAAW